MKMTKEEKIIVFYQATGFDVNEKTVQFLNDYWTNDLLDRKFHATLEEVQSVMSNKKKMAFL